MSSTSKITPEEALQKVAEYILSSQTPEGGIADRPLKTPGRRFERLLMIYNFSSIGLLHFYDITGDKKFLEAAKKWILFWKDRQNRGNDRFGFEGTFYDYLYDPESRLYKRRNFGYENLANLGGAGYDSSDAYPSMWLLTLLGYYNRTHDFKFVKDLKENILLAAESILITWNKDNLTWCHPNHRTVYLMDETETYAGLASAEKLFNILGEDQRSRAFSNFKELLLNAVMEILWDNEKKEFRWGYEQRYEYTDFGKIKTWREFFSTDWKRWFPDACENIWPILWELVSPEDEKAKLVWEKFNNYFPNWYSENSMVVQTGVVAAIMGDREKAEKAFEKVAELLSEDSLENIGDEQSFGITHEVGLFPLLYKYTVNGEKVSLLE